MRRILDFIYSKLRAGKFARRLFIKRVLVLLIATVFALVLAEMIIAIGNFDWNFFAKTLYYQGADIPAYISDPNPDLLYRLRPNAIYKNIQINSVGERGPERSVQKPEGVYRIICLGGSNVYGAGLKNPETWPAKLETRLNNDFPGSFEVWNFGTSAYVPSQMATLGVEVIEKFDPDLVIFALSNYGPKAFLLGADIKEYFSRFPELWEYYLDPDSLESRCYDQILYGVRHSHLFRLVYLWGLSTFSQSSFSPSRFPPHKKNKVRTREFIKNYRDKVKMVIFICPAANPKFFTDYWKGMTIPVMILTADDKDKNYKTIHPPAFVMDYYAENLELFLQENNLVPMVDK